MAIDPVWIALIGTVMGGTGLKVVERWLERPRDATNDALKIRDELRLEITSLREENKKIEVELEEWRAKYYDLRDTYAQAQTQLEIALDRIKTLSAQTVDAAKAIDKDTPD